MLQFREAEERRRVGAERQLDGAETLLDLVLDLLLVQLLAVEVGMRPGVGADGMAGGIDLAENFRVIAGMLADRKEHRLGALVRQRLEHRGGVARPRTVIEGQHDFLVGEKIELLEIFETEAGSAGGVDLDDAADAERVRIGARRPGGLRGHGGRGSRRGRRCCGLGRDRGGHGDIVGRFGRSGEPFGLRGLHGSGGRGQFSARR